MAIPRILFITENDQLENEIRQYLKEKIRNEEFRLEFAYKYDSAEKQIAEAEDIQLVVSRLGSNGEGIGIFHGLKRIPGRAVKCVAILPPGNPEIIRKAMQAGAFDFVLEPVQMGDLLATIEKALEEVKILESGLKAGQDLIKAKLQKEKAEESEQIKKEFFANLTHELRTPLTLILGPVERLIEDTREFKTREQLQIVKRNARHLLGLINQLLDISKLEAGSMVPDYVHDDIVKFLKDTVNAFKTLAEDRKIELKFSAIPEEIRMDFDPAMMEKVIFNLIGNGLKFTEEGGTVTVIIQKKSKPGEPILISVKDTGIGIPEHHLPRIFDRFYQVENTHTKKIKGTGIGLALTKELVDLLGGEIECKSVVGLGSEFTIRLKEIAGERNDPERRLGLSRNHVPDPLLVSEYEDDTVDNQESIEMLMKETEEEDSNASMEPVILIIEDNHDLRHYLRSCLPEKYVLLESPNGEEGVEMAIAYLPDLIVCDVMMPGMDGFGVCEILKANIRTSHVPIILLTARTDMESKIEGLQYGADDYVTKPFNPRELVSRAENLITGRRKLKEIYKQQFIISPGEVKATSMEDEFLMKVRRSVDAHLDDESFSIEELASEVGMSRTQLHRKLRALTDQSASQFVRVYRLDYAKQLLEQHAGTVAEIAYKVGFGSPSYFTKCFTEKYGISPKDIRKTKVN